MVVGGGGKPEGLPFPLPVCASEDDEGSVTSLPVQQQTVPEAEDVWNAVTDGT